MIKTIETTPWNEIETKITQLPEEKQHIYQSLKSSYEVEISRTPVDHEKIAILIREASELLEG